MASYNITLFLNSGFNAINIPDNPDTLESAAGGITTAPAVQILQNRFLGSIRISANWDIVKDCDYIKVGDMYYSVQGVRMLSDNAAELSITPDFITSAGGFKESSGTITTNFDILDGITERSTVSDDTFGLYTDADPLTSPQQTLQLETEWDIPANANSTGMALASTAIGVDPNSAVFCETSLDLAGTYCSHNGKTYTTSAGDVTVPTVENSVGSETSYGFQSDPDIRVSNGTRVYVKNQNFTDTTAGADAQSTIEAGIAQARSLGVESAIFDQWAVPTGFLGTITYTNSPKSVEDASSDEVSVVTDQRTTMIQGAHGSISTGLKPKYATVKNNRALYGEYNSYGIITCAGNSCTFKPEEILTASEFTNDTSPTVDFESDPRPQGKPYYRFTNVNGNSEFWRNALAGETWARVPLTYESASGNELTRFRAVNSLQAQNTSAVAGGVAGTISSLVGAGAGLANYGSAMGEFNSAMGEGYSLQNQYVGSLIGAGYAPTSGSMSTAASRIGSAIGGVGSAVSGLASLIPSQISGLANSVANIVSYKATLQNELSQLYTTQTVYTPQVAFSYNPSILRDIKNNGFMLFRYRYKDTDISRVDKLLTMYGYKEAEELTVANFFRRQYFDFVQCGSVTVTGLPRWWNDGIAMQLKNGVRVWHVKPDPSHYSDNPIRS